MNTCVLCGTTSPDVQPGIVEWRSPIGREAFTAVPRCKDKAACRRRVEATGELWDVRDPGEAA